MVTTEIKKVIETGAGSENKRWYKMSRKEKPPIYSLASSKNGAMHQIGKWLVEQETAGASIDAMGPKDWVEDLREAIK